MTKALSSKQQTQSLEYFLVVWYTIQHLKFSSGSLDIYIYILFFYEKTQTWYEILRIRHKIQILTKIVRRPGRQTDIWTDGQAHGQVLTKTNLSAPGGLRIRSIMKLDSYFPCVNHRKIIITWWCHQMEHFPHNWCFVRGIHRSLVDSPHNGQWHRAVTFSLICAWTKGWANNRNAGDLRCHHAY